MSEMQPGGATPGAGEAVPEGDRISVFFEAMTTAIGVETVFGEPVTVGEKVIIPVAETGMGGGLGYGQGPATEGEEKPRPMAISVGGGAGGGASTRPVAAIVVTPEAVKVQPIVDVSKLALSGLASSAAVWKGAMEFLRALRRRR